MKQSHSMAGAWLKYSAKPARQNPIPVTPTPLTEPPDPEPDKMPKRKKKHIYEIVMG